MTFGGINRVRMWALASVSAIAMAHPAWAAEDAARPFNIPAQDMAAALDAFGQQGGADILYQRDQVQGRRSATISGRLTPLEALTRLTAGTGLTIRRVNATTFMVEPAASQGQASAGAVTENPVEVVVTGTHIRGGNPTSPVHTITRSDIEQSGYSQVGDVIRSLPENFNGGQNPGVLVGSSNPDNANATNSSTVNLRGLGTDATLVLVNGHRLAADAWFQGSDISGIPLAAISRIEVVPDGASAIYGSDAVAGVVNFVMRKDYDGGLVSARLGADTQGGGQEQTYTYLQGIARPNWNLLANVEYSKQDEVTAGEREFTANAYPTTSLSWPQTRRSLFINYGWTVSDKLKFNLDALASDRTSHYALQYVAGGDRYDEDQYITSYSISPSFDYRISDNWLLSATATISDDVDRFHDFSYYWGSLHNTASYNNNLAEAYNLNADGTLFHLPSGDVKTAFGIGYRNSGFRQDYPGNSSYENLTENVKYVYGEVQAPLVRPSDTRTGLHELEVSVSGRSEDYSTFGSTATPKVGLRYKPFDSLTLRASWGKSFKAPSFRQRYDPYYALIYISQAYGYNGGGQSFYLTGGNPNLKPERSTSSTFTADYQPTWVDGLKLSATYFMIDYRDRVVNPISDVTSALSNPIYASFVQYYPSLATQAALTSNAAAVEDFLAVPYDPSAVSALIDNRYQNATAQTVRGIDLSAHKDFTIGAGKLSLFTNVTQTHLAQKTLPALPSVTLSGTIFNVPKLRSRSGLNWKSGNWTVSGIVNYISPETDTGIASNPRIASWTTIDSNLAYTFGGSSGVMRGVQLSLAAANLFDKNPPYALSPALVLPGMTFDSTNASVIGRQISLTLSKAW